MSEQVMRAQDTGGLLRAEAPCHTPNKVIRLAKREIAPTDDPIFRQLRNALQRAVDANGDLADLSGAKRPVGIADALKTLHQGGEHATVREIIQGSFTTPPVTKQVPSTQPTPGIRWPNRPDRHR